MRPARAFPFNEPDGTMFRPLRAIQPDLKEHFGQAYLWPVWEDPIILSGDAAEPKRKRENSLQETHKRPSYVLPMIETLTRPRTNGERR